MSNYNGIIISCLKCEKEMRLYDFVHITSIIKMENNKNGIKHLLSTNDFCPKCHSLFSIKIGYIENERGTIINDLQIKLDKIKLISNIKVNNFISKYKLLIDNRNKSLKE